MRDRAALFWTLAFPLVFIVLFGLIFQGSGATRLTLGWVDDGRVGRVARSCRPAFAALDRGRRSSRPTRDGRDARR